MHGRKPAREPESDKDVDVFIHTPHDQVVIIDVGDLVGETQGIPLCGGYRLESKLNATRRGLPPPTSTLRFLDPRHEVADQRERSLHVGWCPHPDGFCPRTVCTCFQIITRRILTVHFHRLDASFSSRRRINGAGVELLKWPQCEHNPVKERMKEQCGTFTVASTKCKGEVLRFKGSFFSPSTLPAIQCYGSFTI